MKNKVTGFAARAAGLAMLATGFGGVAHAQSTSLDIQVGAKAAAFVEPALTGDVPTAIVFDPANPASKADADAIMAAMGDGLKIKSGTLRPQLVPVGDAASLANVQVAFLAHGVGDGMGPVSAAAAANSVLTISNDMSCVETDRCVVGVQSKPKVLIVVSKSATSASKLQFGAAFLMMVKER
ncbi:hypothetical protein [Pseudokordiimonas caeni]|uniref:hypothetical protein n=1 Tax=Pseudokordiimonas caeni TaxID=2997908 RepID=UPI002810C4AF|nr:hypothetical protein [Pseudokordiimonas caeni]